MLLDYGVPLANPGMMVKLVQLALQDHLVHQDLQGHLVHEEIEELSEISVKWVHLESKVVVELREQEEDVAKSANLDNKDNLVFQVSEDQLDLLVQPVSLELVGHPELQVGKVQLEETVKLAWMENRAVAVWLGFLDRSENEARQDLKENQDMLGWQGRKENLVHKVRQAV